MNSIWHPYPKQRPEKAGSYLVTTNDNEVAVALYSGRKNPKDPDDYECWEDDYTEFEVRAWAELPRPYYPRAKRGEKK